MGKRCLLLGVGVWLLAGDVSAAPSPYGPPTSPAATALDCSALNISWQPPASGVPSSYAVYREDERLASATGLSYVDTRRLVPGKSYAYRVVAVYGLVERAVSFSATVPLCKVTSLLAKPRDCDTGFHLSWAFALLATGSDNVIGQPAGYEVYRGGKPLDRVAEAALDDVGLDAGTYSYTVVPILDGLPHAPNAVSGTLVSRPECRVGSVSAAATSCTAVKVTWAVPAAGAPQRYDVLRNGLAVGSTTALAFTDAPPGTQATSTYSVKAIYSGNVGHPPTASASGTRPPCALASLEAAGTGCSPAPSLSLTWAPASSGPAAASYRVYRGGAQVGSAGAGAASFVDSAGLAPTAAYDYQVAAVGATGLESALRSVSAVLPPCEVRNLQVGTTCRSVDLAWDPPAFGPVEGYRVYRDHVLLFERGDLAFFEDDLASQTGYEFWVTAVAAGQESRRAAVSTATAACPVEGLRVAATGGACGTEDVQLAWDAPHGGPPLRYDVWRNGEVVGSTAELAYTDLPVEDFTSAYSYAVTPVYAGGPGAARTVRAFLEGCGTVTDFQATPVPGGQCNSVQFTWTRPAATPQSYNLYRNGVLFNQVPSGAAQATGPAQNVLCGASYRYEIRPVYDGVEGAGASASATLPETSLPAGGYTSYALLVKPADVTEVEAGADSVRDLLYTGAFSVNQTFQEMTYGRGSLPEGPVYGWIDLPKTRAEYGCFPVASPPYYSLTGCNTALMRAEAVFALAAQGVVLPQEDVSFLGVAGAVGASAAGQRLQLGGFHLAAPGSWYHEFAHFAGRATNGHAHEWSCPDGVHVGPDLADVTAGGCRVLSYADATTVSSGGFHHLTAYHKARMGALDPEQVRVLPEPSGGLEEFVLYLDQLELRRAPADALYDARWKEVRIPLGPDAWYSLEYRTPLGFDAVVPTPQGDVPAVPAGVYVRFKPNTGLHTGGGDLFTSATPFQVRAFTPGEPFVDPYRHITVEVLDTFGEGAEARARIRIRRGQP